jgi:hypothetical protein
MQGTTTEELRLDNPGKNPCKLNAGDEIDYRKADMEWVVTCIRPITPELAADAYNKGDPGYKKKLHYCLWMFNGGKS